MAKQTKKIVRPHETWLMTLKGCHKIRRHKQWVIGDAIVESQKQWDTWNPSVRKSFMWQQAVKATGHPEDSLFQYARVAGVFPPKTRLYDLPFSVYHAIAGIADEDVRLSLCKEAIRRSLSGEEVRLRVQKIQNKKTKSPTKKLSLKISVEIYSRLRDMAIAKGMTVKKLVVDLLETKG